MRITIATGLYPPEIGGPATHTVLLEEKLPFLGYEVTVVPFSVSRKYPKLLRHLHYCWQLIKVAPKTDIFFAQDTVSVGLPALLVSKLSRTTIFVRVPGDYAWEQAQQRFGVEDGIDIFQNRKYGWSVECLRWIQSLVTKNADMVLTPSDYFNDLVRGWGVDKDKVKTVYNGINFPTEDFEIDTKGKKTIVTAGRLVPWKGFAVMISMMRKLEDWNLVILGDGPLHDELKKLIADERLEDRVQMPGKVDREEVFGWCKAADAFVLNTHFESFSYQVVEALYSGTPVIVTSVGSLPEIVSDKQNGLLLMPDDIEGFVEAILSTKTDPGTWEDRTAEAKKTAQKFGIDKTISKLDSLMRIYE